MGQIGWFFPPLSGGLVQGYTNNDIEAFKGELLIDNLSREICQNSLDAHNPESDKPVKVIFELKAIPNKYDVFEEYKKHVDACIDFYSDNADERVKLFLQDAAEMLEQDEIPTLIVGDYETTGLKGSRNVDDSQTSTWEALTGADGLSVKDSDTSGGSYGIGKNAPFACSGLSMVFYNTYDIKDEKAFVGVGRLATHKIYNENTERYEKTQRTGRYQWNDNDNYVWKPIFPEQENEFRDLFSRDEHGTDVIVVGFNQANNWIDKVTEAVLKNFFVAIAEENLIVELKEDDKCVVIDHRTIEQMINDHVDSSNDMLITSQLYQAFNESEPIQLDIIEDSGEVDAEVYFKSDNSFKRYIGHFRDTGMLIYARRRVVIQQFAAVFVVRGKMLGQLLRATEPARHDKWDHTLIDSPSKKDKRELARKSLQRINDKMTEIITNYSTTEVSDFVDAVGVSQFLPAQEEDGMAEGKGTDILRPIIQIGDVNTVPEVRRSIRVRGKIDTGRKVEGEYDNERKHSDPNPDPDPDVIKPTVKPGSSDHEGVTQGKGTKILRQTKMKAQRAFPMSSQNGVYKIVIVPEHDYDNLYIKCSAFGENGKSDEIKLKSFKDGSKSIRIKDNFAGPLSVKSEKASEFIVTLDTSDKLVLNMDIRELR